MLYLLNWDDLFYMEKPSGAAWSPVQVIAPSHAGFWSGQLASGADGGFHLLYGDKGLYKYRRTYPSKQNGEAVLSQTLTVPAGANAARLSFFYQVGGAASANATGFTVRVQAPGGATDVFSTQTNTQNWTFQSIDLSAWGGQTVTLSFRVNQVAGDLPTWAMLDDVALGSTYPDVWSALALHSGPPGAQVAATLSCGNQGGAPASDVDLALKLPEGISLVSASPAPDSLLPTPTWHIGSLPAKSQGCAIQLQLKFADNLRALDKLTAQASLTSSSNELETTNNQMNVDLVIPYYTIYLPRVIH